MAEADWYVVRTNIRCEQRAARSLRAAGYRVYVPQMRKDIVHHRTKKWVTRRFVLFNRYIFVRLVGARKRDFYTLRGCDGVESLLGVNGLPHPVATEMVTRFMLAQRRRQFDDIHVAEESGRARRNKAKARFRRGVKISVLEGPFIGFAGHVTDVTGRGLIKAAIQIFGRWTPVEFEMGQLETLDRRGEAA